MAVNAALILRMAKTKLSDKAILTRLALGAWANPDGCASPSQEALAQITDQSPRSIGRHLTALERGGFIRMRRRVGHGQVEWELLDAGDPPAGQPAGEEPEVTRRPAPLLARPKNPARQADPGLPLLAGDAAGGNGQAVAGRVAEARGSEHRIVIEIRGLPGGASVRQGA